MITATILLITAAVELTVWSCYGGKLWHEVTL